MTSAGAFPGQLLHARQEPRTGQVSSSTVPRSASTPTKFLHPSTRRSSHARQGRFLLGAGSFPLPHPRSAATVRGCFVRASDPGAPKPPEPESLLASSASSPGTPRALQRPQASASVPVTAVTEQDVAPEPSATAESIPEASGAPGRGWFRNLLGSFSGPEVEIGFTRSNELVVGRVAMLGFGASLIGEALTGKGPLAQLKMETGIPIYEAEPLLLFFILFTLVGAVRGVDSDGKAHFRNDSDKSQQWPKPKGSSIRGFLGLPESGPLFSFSTPNELFVGRVAQLGFACALIGEILTGKGALAQLRLETGIPVTEVEPLIILSIAFFFLSAINPETGRFFKNEDSEDER